MSARALHIFMLLPLVMLVLASKKQSMVKFPKDQSMTIIFPPKLDLPSAPGLPIGHLRPLGHQRRSTGEVRQASHTSWNATNPLLFKGVIKDPTNHIIWPTKDNTDAKFADRKVLITKRSMSSTTRYETESYANYVDKFDSEEWILDQILPTDLIQNVKVPKGFECLANSLYSVSSSLSSGTTSDDMRISQQNNLQCVISGRRDYIIMRKVRATPTVKVNHLNALCDLESVVDLDPELVNVFDNPWITAMTWQHASLSPGDCILLPADTIFHTNSYGYCETVSYRWNKSKQSCRKEKGMKSAVKPHVCSNKHSLKPEMCEFSDMDPVERWREFLISLMSDQQLLSQACFSQIVDDQVDADVLFSWFDTIPVTAEALLEMKSSTLRKIMEASITKVSSSHDGHKHDEL